LLFRHLGGRILLFIRANVPLLYHQRVKILDIFLARAVLEDLFEPHRFGRVLRGVLCNWSGGRAARFADVYLAIFT
jgi:hypothetical protein